MAIQGVASIAKAQLKADRFVSNPENEVGMKMHNLFNILSSNKLTIETPHKYHIIVEMKNMKFEMVSKTEQFCQDIVFLFETQLGQLGL